MTFRLIKLISGIRRVSAIYMQLFFSQVGKTHEEIDKIARLLPFVSHKDEEIDITETIDPGKLLPGKPISNDDPSNSVIVPLIKHSVYSSHTCIQVHSLRDPYPCRF